MSMYCCSRKCFHVYMYIVNVPTWMTKMASPVPAGSNNQDLHHLHANCIIYYKIYVYYV